MRRYQPIRWILLCTLIAACRLDQAPSTASDASSEQLPKGKGDAGDMRPSTTRDATAPSDASLTMDAAQARDASVQTDARVLDASPRKDAGSIADAALPDGGYVDAASRVDADLADASVDAAVPDAAVVDASDPKDAATHATGDAASEDAGDGAMPPRSDGCPLDAPLPLTRVRVLPAAGQEAMVVGARIQGSLSGPTTDFVDLATITQAPAPGSWAQLEIQAAPLYRYLRYYAAPGSQGGISEIELYSAASRLSGSSFGTVSSDGQHVFALALDADEATYFTPNAAGGGYVGLDIARGYVTAPVSFTPSPASSSTPISVTLASATPNATILYTIDGSAPSSSTAQSYTAPIEVTEGRTLVRALARSSCRFDSAQSTATYAVGSALPEVTQGLTSYHIGNSLTDTINPWLKPIADSSGIHPAHTYYRWTIPGAPIAWLHEHKGDGIGTPDEARVFDSFVQSAAPIDHLSLQPYSDPDFPSQGGAAASLISTALSDSPELQVWIYMQWPGRTEWETDGFSNGYSEWSVEHKPTSWEEAVPNQLLYHEAFRDYVESQLVLSHKPLLIVPAGLALLELKRQMDSGAIGGLSDFFASMFEDEEHLRAPAQYLVSLVFYSCLYRQSPEGRVTYSGTGLTEPQALALQRIAWNAASAYDGSGISP